MTRTTTLSLLAVALAGCGTIQYRNAVNPSAGQVEFDRDWYACRQENTGRKTTLDQPAPYAPYEYRSRLVVDEGMAQQCMAARGWQPVNLRKEQEQLREREALPRCADTPTPSPGQVVYCR